MATVLAGLITSWCPQDAMSQQAELPGPQSLASQLSGPETRQDALLTLAAVLRGHQRWVEGDASAFSEGISQDLAWLQRLQERHGAARATPPILDPAEWMIRQNLQRQKSPDLALPGPRSPGLDQLLRASFQRADERLAAAVLPELIWLLGAEATLHWSRLLDLAIADEALGHSLSQVGLSWAAPEGRESAAAAEGPRATVTAMVHDAVNPGPPDAEKLSSIRFDVYAALPSLDEPTRYRHVAYMRLAELIDGLHEGRYVAFATGLLAVAGDLLEADPGAASPVAEWLSEYLPVISASFARAYSSVDPRLNSALAAAYDVARNLPVAAADPGFGDEVADAVAQMAMLMPDIEYYFGLPVRDTITGNVDACIGLAAGKDEAGNPEMSRELFDDCIDSLIRLAETQTRSAALSGDADGPFGDAQLQREVSVTAVQRINYALGYLHQRDDSACEPPANPLPNPLEWSSLATLMAWFAEQMPVYFQTPENEARLMRMRSLGAELVEVLSAQTRCFSGTGAASNDVIMRHLADYRAALNLLSRSLRESVAAHRQDILAAGADIALESDGFQATLYRPEGQEIGPCDPDRVCELSRPLSTNRALLGLFPEPYLIADQSGMGRVQLCYDNMEWVDRRSEQVRPDDENVANYFGRFAFDLQGRFIAGSEASEVFSFRFTSPDEYHYLFAAANDEVLEDSCPMEWVGSRIVTPLPNRRGGIVPNRLTYLAAPRMLPSRLLDQNWETGAEWRDWFATGLGVEPLTVSDGDAIVPAVTEHLQALYLNEQSTIYRGLLSGVGTPQPESSREYLRDLSTRKGLLKMLVLLLYPQSLSQWDAIRSGLAGQGGLIDDEMIERFQGADIPVNRIGEIGLARLDAFTDAWRRQAEATLQSGSISSDVAHALLRLDAIYQSYFAPSAPLPAVNERETPVSDSG